MKLQAYGFILTILTTSSFLVAEENMKSYANKVIEIQEFSGATTYTLALKCDQLHPIVVYAPVDFAESQDDFVHRYLLPNTVLSQDLSDLPVSVTSLGSQVEILLHGRLLNLVADDNRILFRVQLNHD